MIVINTNKLLIITWVAMALLIGLGIGYLLGVQGFGQKVQSPPVQAPQQQNFGPAGNMMQQQQPNQGGAPAGAPGGRNPAPNGAPERAAAGSTITAMN